MSVSVLDQIFATDPPEREWSAKYLVERNRRHSLSGVGVAEIKPHKDAQIRRGLHQLRDYLYADPAMQTGRGTAWLITYLPVPGPTKGPRGGTGQALRVIAHEINQALLLPARTTSYRRRTIPGLDSLTVSRRVLETLPLPQTMPFPTPAQPDLFGLAVEDRVRRHFRRQLGIRTQRRSTTRADIHWELSELYRAIAQETGDAYWREVAQELATSGA